jgi:hypothetical protein
VDQNQTAAAVGRHRWRRPILPRQRVERDPVIDEPHEDIVPLLPDGHLGQVLSSVAVGVADDVGRQFLEDELDEKRLARRQTLLLEQAAKRCLGFE